MVTITDNGLDQERDILIGDEDQELHEVAVGSGSGNEGSGATSLANEEYRSHKDNDDVDITAVAGTGDFEVTIRVSGGGSTANVSGGTSISEMAVFFTDGTMYVIDDFTGVSIPDGHTESFTMPVDIQQG